MITLLGTLLCVIALVLVCLSVSAYPRRLGDKIAAVGLVVFLVGSALLVASA